MACPPEHPGPRNAYHAETMSTFRADQRVRVAATYHWAQGATGRIGLHPASQGTVSRIVPSRHGPLTFYWVQFDLPHLDADGDGPYHEAEIDAHHL